MTHSIHPHLVPRAESAGQGDAFRSRDGAGRGMGIPGGGNRFRCREFLRAAAIFEGGGDQAESAPVRGIAIEVDFQFGDRGPQAFAEGVGGLYESGPLDLEFRRMSFHGSPGGGQVRRFALIPQSQTSNFHPLILQAATDAASCGFPARLGVPHRSGTLAGGLSTKSSVQPTWSSGLITPRPFAPVATCR